MKSRSIFSAAFPASLIRPAPRQDCLALSPNAAVLFPESILSTPGETRQWLPPPGPFRRFPSPVRTTQPQGCSVPPPIPPVTRDGYISPAHPGTSRPPAREFRGYRPWFHSDSPFVRIATSGHLRPSVEPRRYACPGASRRCPRRRCSPRQGWAPASAGTFRGPGRAFSGNNSQRRREPRPGYTIRA